MQSPYLYLEKIEYAKTWVNGGTIPIKIASCYRADERSGIYTPDENIIDTTVDHVINNGLNPAIRMYPGNSITFSGCGLVRCYGEVKNLSGHYSIGIQDGLILSFCRVKSKIVMSRLKKKICIQINDIFKLKKYIDKQLDCVGEYKSCKYTYKHNRDHFLKSKSDEWQEEYRIFWNIHHQKEIWVDIPKNMARICKL